MKDDATGSLPRLAEQPLVAAGRPKPVDARWSTPPLKARWYDGDDDVQAENDLKTTSASPVWVEQQHLTVQGFFDLLSSDEPPTS